METNNQSETKKKTPLTYKIILGVALVVVFVIVVNSKNDLNDTLDSGKVSSEKNREQLDKYQAIVDNAETVSKNTTIYKIGESASLGGAIVTLNKIAFSQGGQFSKPQSGNEWINLNLTIENTESIDKHITTMGQMFVRDGENNSYQVAVTDKSLESVNNNLDGSIIAKSKRTGWVGFEIKKGAKGLKFQYNGSLWGGGNILFELGR
jgi:hypothetical protein